MSIFHANVCVLCSEKEKRQIEYVPVPPDPLVLDPLPLPDPLPDDENDDPLDLLPMLALDETVLDALQLSEDADAIDDPIDPGSEEGGGVTSPGMSLCTHTPSADSVFVPGT